MQSPPHRYAVIDRTALTEVLGVDSFQRYQQLLQGWLESELKSAQLRREPVWTQSLAVGHKDYVEGVRLALGVAGRHRSVIEGKNSYELKETGMSYGIHLGFQTDALSAENTILVE